MFSLLYYFTYRFNTKQTQNCCLTIYLINHNNCHKTERISLRRQCSVSAVSEYRNKLYTRLSPIVGKNILTLFCQQGQLQAKVSTSILSRYFIVQVNYIQDLYICKGNQDYMVDTTFLFFFKLNKIIDFVVFQIKRMLHFSFWTLFQFVFRDRRVDWNMILVVHLSSF